MLKRLTGAGGPLGNLNLDFGGDAVRTMLTSLWQDLRAKRLLPVAALLLVALIAVPVLLSSSPTSPPEPAPLPTLPPPVRGLPAVTQRLVPAAELRRSGRDPFSPQPGTSTAASSTTPSGPISTGAGAAVASTGTIPPGGGSSQSTPGGSAPSGSSPSGGSGGGGSGSGGSGSGGSGSGGSGSGGKTPSSNGSLGPRQSYGVQLAITNTAGGIDTFAPLLRLTELPSTSQPLMIYLGVLKGGHKVLFALEPGTVVSGPGQCVPGPIDCQIVVLGPNQDESLGVNSGGDVTKVALFAVTGISVVSHSSVSAAQQARRAYSAAGQALLDQTGLSALSLFPYEPSIGAVVDKRNLTFGANP